MKIAWVSPLPPIRSGIADYSEELIPFLAAHACLELFVDGYVPGGAKIKEQFKYFDTRGSSRRLASSDVVVYQIGNSALHGDALRLLPRYPGVSVLHEYVLHHAIVELTVARGDRAGYVREMGYCYGPAGAGLAREVLWSKRGFPYEQFPLNQRVFDASLGLIVHSHYIGRMVQSSAPEIPVAVIPHHILPNPELPDAATARRQLGLPLGDFLIGAFGRATPPKRLDVALRALARLRARAVDARFLVVGEVADDYDLRSVISKLELDSVVHITGYVDKVDLLRYVAAVDVGVSLRWPTLGETSGTLMRLLAAGKPTIMSNVGAFAEIPDECVWKVPVGGDEEDRILFGMLSLASDRELQLAIGQRARSYVSEYHSIERSAAAYVSFIRRILR